MIIEKMTIGGTFIQNILDGISKGSSTKTYLLTDSDNFPIL